MTESRCWSEGRAKATKGGTSYTEQNSVPLFNKLCYSCRIQEQLGFVEFGWLSRIYSQFNFLWRITSPHPPLIVASRVGFLNEGPQYSYSHGVGTWYTLGPSDSSKQTDVRKEKWLGSSDFGSDSDELVTSFKLPRYWIVLLPILSQTCMHSVSYKLLLQ